MKTKFGIVSMSLFTHTHTQLSGQTLFWRCQRPRLTSRPSPRTRSAGRVARVAAGRQGNRASAAAVPRPGPGPAPAPPLLKERRREGEEERGRKGEQERGEYKSVQSYPWPLKWKRRSESGLSR